jgi:uncharacterized protein YjbI with pentapeptide repeats
VTVFELFSSMLVTHSADAKCPSPGNYNYNYMSFSGCDIRDWDFRPSMTFVGSNFFESNLIGADLSGIDFSSGIFIKTKLSDTVLNGTKFTNSFFLR